MSAYKVGPEHLGAIIRWYLRDQPRVNVYRPYWNDRPATEEHSAKAMLDTLALENHKSVAYRYNNEDDLPGPVGVKGPVKASPVLDLYTTLTPVEVLKAIDCLEYQSCEHPTWESSPAYKLLAQIRKAAISSLPGYDEADVWDITRYAAATSSKGRK